jgi:DHA1 family multidrug resistance protein-like MFS transporter
MRLPSGELTSPWCDEQKKLILSRGVAAICGPVLGPLVGGFAAQHEDWTWPIWELVWLSGFCWVFLMFFFPETSANNLLVRRTKRLRKLTGNQSLRCEAELMGEDMSTKDIVLTALIRPLTLNFTEGMSSLQGFFLRLIFTLILMDNARHSFRSQPVYRAHLWLTVRVV